MDMLVCRLKKGTQIAQLLEKEKKGELEKILSESLAPMSMLTPLRKIRDISLIMAASLAVSSRQSRSHHSNVKLLYFYHEFESDNLAFMFYILFLIGRMFLCRYRIIGRKKNIAAYEEIYAAYPERPRTISISCWSKRLSTIVLKIAVYKDHLIPTIEVSRRLISNRLSISTTTFSPCIAVRCFKQKLNLVAVRNNQRNTKCLLRTL